MGNLDERDYLSYRKVYELITANLPRPDLLLFLTAPVSVLGERIHRRGRSIESGITSDYLALLDRYYEEWLQIFDLCPVLTIRSQDLDFVHRPKHLDIVINRIQEKLAGREDMVLS